MSIIVAILIFAFLIFFHELGHFSLAKKFGVKVNEFCIGFGPKLFGFTKGDTLYALRLLPLGGACAMEGEDEDSDDPAAFNKKPLWQRAIVVFAGPFFNFILAYILAVIILCSVGYDKPVITDVIEDYPAAEAGILPGDEIVKLNGYPVNFYRDISIYTRFHNDDEVDIVYKRDGVKYKTHLTPKFDNELGRYLFGFSNSAMREKIGPIKAMGLGFAELKYQVYTVIQSLRMLITRQLSVNDMSGPVGIVKAIGDTYTESSKDGIYYVVINMLNFTLLISANLGVMNLLPIPALDGGRLFIFLFEAIRRKKLSEEVEGRIHLVGFGLLMALMVVIMFNDIRKLFM